MMVSGRLDAVAELDAAGWGDSGIVDSLLKLVAIRHSPYRWSASSVWCAVGRLRVASREVQPAS